MIKKYNEFLNEGLLDKLRGPNDEEVISYYGEDNMDELLMKAIWNGELSGVEFAIEHGADVNFSNGRPLIYSCINGNKKIVEFLLEHGADVSNKNYEAVTLAYSKNNHDIIELLFTYIDKKSHSYKYYIGDED